MTKVIAVPKDEDAMKALDFDQATDGQLSELFLNDEDFKKLWTIGLFDSINELTGTLIDEYEDDNITDMSKLKLVLESSLLDEAKYSSELSLIISRIKDLFKEAQERGTGIFFYF